MVPALKSLLKQTLFTALALSIVIMLTAPLFAGAFTQDVTTAKGNETSTDNVLGGVPTRVTWEGVVDEGETLKAVDVLFPEGSDLTDSTKVRVTVLDGTERLKLVEGTDYTQAVDTASESVNVEFNEALDAGLRLRLEIYDAALPNVQGEVSLGGTCTLGDGSTSELPASPAIEVTQASMAQQIVNWLDEQPWVEAWNSVKILNLFFKPQLIVSSIPTVVIGWLLSLMLVLIGFPLAIPIGLIAAFMKISKSRILHVLAAIYTGIVRGTPLFLQIYIAFFGLPLMGVNLNGINIGDFPAGQYLLAILVLAFNSGAYMCEILRAGIQSIPRGQFEASRSLGMTQRQTMFSVVIPQMVRRVIPTMTSEFILLYKDTSLLAAVGVMELMLYAKSVVANTGNMTPYIVAACFYLIVTLPLIHVVGTLEKRLALADEGGGAPKQKKRKNRRAALSQMKEEIVEGADGHEAQPADSAPEPDTAVPQHAANNEQEAE